MNISIDTIVSNISESNDVLSSSLNTMEILSENNTKHIFALKSFASLSQNWDSYEAEKPSLGAIAKAIDFIIYLSNKQVEVFFSAPTPDGDILIEIKYFDAALEFVFSTTVSDKIIATYNNEFSSEAVFNDTTLISYLKWLICPNGSCPDF